MIEYIIAAAVLGFVISMILWCIISVARDEDQIALTRMKREADAKAWKLKRQQDTDA